MAARQPTCPHPLGISLLPLLPIIHSTNLVPAPPPLPQVTKEVPPFKSRLVHISCDGTSRQQPADTETWDVPLPEDWIRRDPLEPKIKPQTYLQLIFTPKDNDSLVLAHQKTHKNKAKAFMVASSRRTIIVQTTAPQPISFNAPMVQAFFEAPLPRFGVQCNRLLISVHFQG